MKETLKLLCVLAHPDDESLGVGGALAWYAAEGVETYLLTATRGERGWTGDPAAYPGPEALGKVRETELHRATAILGVHELAFLDYVDGEVDQADPAEAIAKIVQHVRRVQPQVVVTFGPEGAYGHPDHIAISQFTTAALVCAADPAYTCGGEFPPYRVSKLYYKIWTAADYEGLESLVETEVMEVDGIERRVTTWPAWAVTTRVDTGAYWQTVWEAVSCHQSQLSNYPELVQLTEEQLQRFWHWQSFYRAYSTVNGGHGLERDLFEGLR